MTFRATVGVPEFAPGTIGGSMKMKVLSTAGDPLAKPFASVTRDGSVINLSVHYGHYGIKKSAEMELSEEAFQCLAVAMIRAMRLPEME